MSRAAHAERDALIDVAIRNGGNTRGDAKFDIDGAIGTLAYYADLGAQLGDARLLTDGDGVQLGRSPRFFGQHILVPRPGVAVHINAFNFPAWGLAEKAACALLAGMPVITKPATSTALVALRLMKIFTERAPLPRGALSFVAGPPGDLLTHLGGEDVLAFTGSSATGAALRLMPRLAREGVRVNVEADSLNGAVLGPDAAPGSETYAMFLRDVVRDITQKAGQKCTAIRRVFAPAAVVDAVRDDLVDRLRDARVGDPTHDGVTVGPLTTADQLRGVRAGIERLAAGAAVALGGAGPFEAIGVPPGKGYFVLPTLLVASGPDGAPAAHEHEVFGPVATLFPYDGGAAHAVALLRRGRGSLVCSVYSATTAPSRRRCCSASRRTTAASCSAARRSPIRRPARAPSSLRRSTAARAAPAAARSSAACAGSISTRSAPPCRGRGRSWRRSSGRRASRAPRRRSRRSRRPG